MTGAFFWLGAVFAKNRPSTIAQEAFSTLVNGLGWLLGQRYPKAPAGAPVTGQPYLFETFPSVSERIEKARRAAFRTGVEGLSKRCANSSRAEFTK